MARGALRAHQRRAHLVKRLRDASLVRVVVEPALAHVVEIARQHTRSDELHDALL